ncbi:MAG: hypothetical protein ACE3JP_03025 [Ectobacillus sp.]
MQANINLLPRREKETSPVRILLAVLLIVTLVGSGWTYLAIKKTETEITDVKKQLLLAKVEMKRSQMEGTGMQANEAAARLKQALKQTEEGRLKTVPVLKKITSFLPGRGVFQSFSYQEPGIFIVEVRFDEKRDAAYYYNRLLEENWIAKAKLSYLKAIEIQSGQGSEAGMPRYIARYEFTVKRDEVKSLEKEDQQ